jgi:hypothetical protein
VPRAVVFVVQVAVCATSSLLLIQRSPTECQCGIDVCDLQTATVWRSRPGRAVTVAEVLKTGAVSLSVSQQYC